MMRPKTLFITIILIFSFTVVAAAKNLQITSPGGNLKFELKAGAGQHLQYRILGNGNALVDWSNAGIIINGADYGAAAKIGAPRLSSRNEKYSMLGKHSIGVNRCKIAAIPIAGKRNRNQFTLEVRVFDDGAAFRYIVKGRGLRVVTGESTSWKLPDNSVLWFQNNLENYEGEFYSEKAGKISGNVRLGVPVTVKFPGGAGYGAITEGALFNYSGMNLAAKDGALFAAEFLDDQGGWPAQGKIVSPWRILIAAKDLNGLFNSDIIFNVNEPPDPKYHFEQWAKPGRSLWPCLDGFRTAITPEKIRHNIDAAQQLGYEYVLIDYGWEAIPKYQVMAENVWSDNEEKSYEILSGLVKYGRERNVGLFVWKHFLNLTNADYREKYFKKLHDTGIVGIKIDFMNSESRYMIGFYEACMRDAAKYRLMLDFHGANKPTGEARRWPNEITREGVRGLEYMSSNAAQLNATIPFVRLIAGHADNSPMHFDPKWMTNTTWAHQLATAIIFSSPVTFYAAYADDILQNPARDVIEKFKTTWDETVILPKSEIGEIAAMARRSGNEWFIAVMNGGGPRVINLPLDFLPGGEYDAVLFSDSSEKTDSVKRDQAQFNKTKSLRINMRSGGGFLAHLTIRGNNP